MSLFSHFCVISGQGQPFSRNIKGFHGLFFCGINETQNFKANYTLIKKYAKRSQNVKNEKCIARYFVSLFSRFAPLFFACYISQHFVIGSAFTQKVKEFLGLFFRGINKTRNSHEIKKCIVCFVLHGVFCENICKIPVKYEKCISGLSLPVYLSPQSFKPEFLKNFNFKFNL